MGTISVLVRLCIVYILDLFYTRNVPPFYTRTCTHTAASEGGANVFEVTYFKGICVDAMLVKNYPYHYIEFLLLEFQQCLCIL